MLKTKTLAKKRVDGLNKNKDSSNPIITSPLQEFEMTVSKLGSLFLLDIIEMDDSLTALLSSIEQREAIKVSDSDSDSYR